MCLIVEKRPQDTLTHEEVKRWESANGDGWGLMAVRGDGVLVQKGIGLKALWRAIQEQGGRSYYLHLRMATHGHVKDGNTHPYEVLPGLYLMHNGIVSIDTSTEPDRSDTWHWIEQVLRPMLSTMDASAVIRSAWFRNMVELYGGTSNRFVLMDRHGAVTFNDSAWHTFKGRGMRVSNTYALGYYTSVNSMGTSSYPLALGYPRDYKEYERDTWTPSKGWSNVSAPSEPEADDAAPDVGDIIEDDFRCLIGCEYDDVEQFTYSYPERAAGVLHMLVTDLED